MTILFNKDTNETVKVVKLTEKEAVNASRSKEEADFYKKAITSDFNCYALLSDGMLCEPACSQKSLREYAELKVKELNELGGNWQIKAPHLKLVS